MYRLVAMLVGALSLLAMTVPALAQQTQPPNGRPPGSTGTSVCHFEPGPGGGITLEIRHDNIPTDRGVATIDHDTLAENNVCLTTDVTPTPGPPTSSQVVSTPTTGPPTSMPSATPTTGAVATDTPTAVALVTDTPTATPTPTDVVATDTPTPSTMTPVPRVPEPTPPPGPLPDCTWEHPTDCGGK